MKLFRCFRKGRAVCFSVGGGGHRLYFLEIAVKARNRGEPAFKTNGQNGIVGGYEQFLRVLDTHARDVLLNRHVHSLMEDFA